MGSLALPGKAFISMLMSKPGTKQIFPISQGTGLEKVRKELTANGNIADYNLKGEQC